MSGTTNKLSGAELLERNRLCLAVRRALDPHTKVLTDVDCKRGRCPVCPILKAARQAENEKLRARLAEKETVIAAYREHATSISRELAQERERFRARLAVAEKEVEELREVGDRMAGALDALTPTRVLPVGTHKYECGEAGDGCDCGYEQALHDRGREALRAWDAQREASGWEEGR